MSASLSTVVFWALAAVTLVGALTVVLARDVMRMALGLGAFFLGVAGFFAYYGLGFLALAELFVYVGGVLILFLFAIMLVHRSGAGAPDLGNRFDPLAIVAALGVAAVLFMMLRPLATSVGVIHGGGSTAALGAMLTGPLVVQFEAVGALLLVGLVAVVLVMGGDRR